MFKAVERNRSLTERTEQQIEALIVQQSLRPGERLPPQDKLAQQLGVSRTVIREAVRFLIAKGLIEARKGSGVYVRSSDDAPSPKPASAERMVPKPKSGRMLPEERRRRILEMLGQAESVTVSDLVERLGVSRV